MSANRLNVLVTLMLAVALLVMESGNAQVDVYTQFDSTSKRTSAPQKYCGKKLSNALQIICDGVYNSMFKKNGQGEFQPIDREKYSCRSTSLPSIRKMILVNGFIAEHKNSCLFPFLRVTLSNYVSKCVDTRDIIVFHS